MGLWGTTTAAGDKPKFLPIDSNAAGSMGARENAIAVAGGWGLSPGLAASGNDNTAATPEVLVCVKNLAVFIHKMSSFRCVFPYFSAPSSFFNSDRPF